MSLAITTIAHNRVERLSLRGNVQLRLRTRMLSARRRVVASLLFSLAGKSQFLYGERIRRRGASMSVRHWVAVHNMIECVHYAGINYRKLRAN